MVSFKERSYVMGIMNITPDSFSGDGLAGDEDAVIAQARLFLKAGADILDFGAESTRPGAEKISSEKEKKRLLPAIDAVLKIFPQAFISVDTMKAEIAEQALAIGAKMINDVSALAQDKAMASVVARHRAFLVLMDNRVRGEKIIKGKKEDMHQPETSDKDIVTRVGKNLQARADFAKAEGIATEKIILDPGIGFGKSVEQNMALIAGMDKICLLGYSVLLGASRKSFMGCFLNLPVDQRVEAGLAVTAIARMRGCRIFRTHDVEATVRFCRMVDGVLRYG